jgi:hypothetical protein
LEWATVGIELDLESSRVREPDDLLVRSNHDNFGEYANQDQFFRHRCAFLQCHAKIAQHTAGALGEYASRGKVSAKPPRAILSVTSVLSGFESLV